MFPINLSGKEQQTYIKYIERRERMNDLERAKQILEDEACTCVLCRGDEIIKSTLTGIAPMVNFLADQKDMRGFSAADRIVGKAAAMLFVLAGVKEVYACVMSESGKDMLARHGISPSYGQLTEHIINRQGSGLCPMEQAVLNLQDPAQGLEAIRRTLCTLSKKKGE